MKSALLVSMLAITAVQANAVVLFSRPPAPSGNLIASSWVWENGSDSDMYAYDDFILPANALLTEVRWRGGHIYNAMYGGIVNFSISVFEGYPGGSWPICGNPGEGDAPYLYKRVANSTCNPTPAPYGLTDYSFTLPVPLSLQGNKAYWLRVEGYQLVYPDWGMATSTAGNGSYFRFSTGMAMFQAPPGNLAFTLIGSYPSTSVSGTVALGDWIAPSSGVPMTVEFLDNALNVVDTQSTTLGASGNYTVNTSRTGSTSVRLSSPHFLTKTVGTFTLSGTAVTGVDASLINGDADGSGEVDAVDIDLVISVFGSADTSGDLDGSGEVDAVDIDIAIANFGAING